jgi:hypothetical protein
MSVIQMPKQKRPEGKIAINFLITKEMDQKFRAFIAEKYHGYRRGALSKEMEIAITHLMETEGKQ